MKNPLKNGINRLQKESVILEKAKDQKIHDNSKRHTELRALRILRI